jgi:integrase/recombinase XerD
MRTDEVPIRSLRIEEWPVADLLAWQMACRPSIRLARGGTASHLKQITRDDLAKRYGLFLNYVDRSGGLDHGVSAAAYIVPDRVAEYVAELKDRVSSVTCYGTVFKLRRMAELLAPERAFGWLREIEQDLYFDMRPAPKFHRVVDADRLVAAGMTLMTEARDAQSWSSLRRARTYRNGLMVALLACAPIRLKNFAALVVGGTFVRNQNRWWICLSAHETKSGRADERPIPGFLTEYIDRYLDSFRSVLEASGQNLWIGAHGRPLAYLSCERIITETTRQTTGIAICPHLFRCCAASTAALYAGNELNLASALLQHSDPTVTEQHYNRACSSEYARAFASLIEGL